MFPKKRRHQPLGDALARYGKPDVFNTDQGSQFTGAAFTGTLAHNETNAQWQAGDRLPY